MPQPLDQFAATLPADKRASVYSSTKGTHEKRTKLLLDHFLAPDRLREIAGEIKQHVIENLDTYLPAVEAKLQANGVQVHVWTIDDPSEMQELLDRGVDGIFTDRTDLLKDVLQGRGQWWSRGGTA